MQAGLTEAIRPYLAAKGWRGEPGRLVTWWRRTHFENSMIDALLHRQHCLIATLVGYRLPTRSSAPALRIPRTRCRHWSLPSSASNPFPTWSQRSNGWRSATGSWCSQRRSRHARGGKTTHRLCVRAHDLGRCRRCVQAACGDVPHGRRDRRPGTA